MGFFDSLKKEVKDFIEVTSNARAAQAPPLQSYSYQYHPRYLKLEKDCKSMNTDLVIATTHCCTCALCSSLQGRVFSLSGKDKRFPRLPDEVKIYGGFHEGCAHTFFPFFYGISTMPNNEDPVKFSNRPYLDYRTPEEKAKYAAEIAKAEAQARSRAEYEWICNYLPELAPKSLGGYTKMKNANSANYQKIVAAAKSKGYTIF